MTFRDSEIRKILSNHMSGCIISPAVILINIRNPKVDMVLFPLRHNYTKNIAFSVSSENGLEYLQT